MSMQGKTVLVTGANQGIGKAAAVELAKMGADVTLVCRNADKAKIAVDEVRAVATGRVDLILADLSTLAGIRGAASEFRARHDRLDVLLNNAGVLATSRRETEDGLETTFATNHINYFLLTHLLLDMLVANAPSRIVNVSSDAHRNGVMQFDDLQRTRSFSPIGAYCQSKLANVLFTYELARRLEGTGVTANCLHPGVISSGFAKTDGGFTAFLAKLASPFLLSPESGARTSIYLASSPEVEGVTGRYFTRCKPKKSSKRSHDEEAARRLWAISEEICGISSAQARAMAA